MIFDNIVFKKNLKVHMVGGIIGLIATVYLKPRRNRFNEDSVHQMSSPTNALLGDFFF